MEIQQLIDDLKTLALQEDVLAVSREINEIKSKFDDQLLEIERRDQVASMEAEVNGEAYEPIDIKPLKEEFYALYNAYRESKTAVLKAKETEETANLSQKKALIERLKHIIQNEENIGAAFKAFKEIHEAWKNVGDIAREKRNDMQHEYSKLLEQFNYQISIYRELNEHDLKRNLQLKEALISQLEALTKSESVRDLESLIKSLQNEWEEVGPVPNEEWEKLKDLYWKHVRAIYDRINVHYEGRRSALAANIQLKRDLLEKTRELIVQSEANSTSKQWDDATEKLLEFQEAWKNIGFGSRKENEEVWQEFRGECDVFFSRKKAFFGKIQEKYSVIAEAKRSLIAQANALRESTDWKATADQLMVLQKKWKESGHAGQKIEQKLWSEFRGACDAFFNARQKHYGEQDQEFETNLAAKQAIILQIENYTVPNTKKQALDDLREFTTAFNAVGRVPIKLKDSIYNAYKTAIDAHYSKIKLEGAEKENVMFQARIDTLAGSQDSARAFSREKSDIRQQIEGLKNEIRQYENNLGFFANSKGADELKKEVEAKINASKNKIEALKRKLSMIPNE